LSPWIEGGKFCGSRGMALPLLGLNVRLKGDAAKTHECTYYASFVDGSNVGPVPGGEACQADSLAALEAFQIVLRRRGAATTPNPTRQPPVRPEPSRPKVAASMPQPAAARTKPSEAADKPVAPAANRGAARTAQRTTPKRPR